MKIIQTLRVNNKDLLTDPFGWRSSQDHIMGWVLSCLLLTKYNDNVELYTDEAGYRLLIEELRLPYKKAHIILDDMNAYRGELWALSKMKVYALQKESFIHVDGDVFVWKEFPQEWRNAPLIAQNLEKGTGYYNDILKELSSSLTFIPEEIDLNITAMGVCSCNAGILGGNDLSFFKKYTTLAFEMVERNDCRQLTFRQLNNFNLVFEQMLFGQLAQREGVRVICMLDQVYEDCGYHFADIGDFSVLPYTNGYIHLLGNHKQNATACDMIHRYVLAHYPQYYFAVKQVFKEPQQFNPKDTSPNSPVIECLPLEIEEIDDSARFDKLLEDLRGRSDGMALQDWISRESACLGNLGYFHLPAEQALNMVLIRDPLVSVVKVTNELVTRMKNLIGSAEGDAHIAISPEIVGGPFQKLLLDTLDCLILCALDEMKSFKLLLDEIRTFFHEEEVAGQYAVFSGLIMEKVNRLCLYKCIKVILPETLDNK